MMALELLPLPVTWLAFYVLGRGTGNLSLSGRRWGVALVSVAVLLVVCGPKTWLCYIGLGSGILFTGEVLNRLKTSPYQKAAFSLSVVAVALLVVLFLKFRIYFHKYFLYLPSLSYLGFRGIAYLTSAYKRSDVPFSAGLMQLFFFPMLFVGPISRTEDFEKEVADYHQVLRRLTLGLAMLIAGHFCARYVLEDVGPWTITAFHWSQFWLGAVANSFQLYFTFGGYTHLIIGLGLLCGFKLPENFQMPYLATSLRDFWRRWHMSLSFWIRDYVYIPLGGSRKGIARKCANLLLAMALCGVWHGLEWHYLLWGLFHGLLLCLESLMARFDFRPLERTLSRAYVPVKVLITFSLVSFGWLLFKYPVPVFLDYLKGLGSW